MERQWGAAGRLLALAVMLITMVGGAAGPPAGESDGDEDGVIPLETIIAAKELNTAIPAEFQSCIELYWKSRSEVLPPPDSRRGGEGPDGAPDADARQLTGAIKDCRNIEGFLTTST
ncbi:hypothetical protein T484DRAFT_1778453 [Baffinella frigidus]|nr:hypothetical protein T484DRAFT_1778453 [Cryptophyta sp. CCMP2293]